MRHLGWRSVRVSAVASSMSWNVCRTGSIKAEVTTSVPSRRIDCPPEGADGKSREVGRLDEVA